MSDGPFSRLFGPLTYRSLPGYGIIPNKESEVLQATYTVMALNGAVFIAWQAAQSGNPQLLKGLERNFTASSNNWQRGRYWTLLTSAFSHRSVGHISGNLVALRTFGQALSWIPGIGLLHFMSLTLGSAIAGSAAWLWQKRRAVGTVTQGRMLRNGSTVYSLGGGSNVQEMMLGASGLVAGAGAAATCLMPFAEMQVAYVPFPVPLWMVTAGYAAWDTYMLRAETSQIAHAAHLGGVLFGVAYYLAFLRNLGNGGVWRSSFTFHFSNILLHHSLTHHTRTYQICMDGATATDSNTQLVTDDFKIRGAAARQSTTTNIVRDVAPDTCTICLEPISERAVASPCNHLSFDFLCLVSWLQERSTCPLCKAAVIEVQYDWRDAEDYETFHVPQQREKSKQSQDGNGSRRRVRGDISSSIRGTAAEDPALQRRRRVYSERSPSLHIGINSVSLYSDFTPQALTASTELQSRARAFLRRELKVFTFLDAACTRRAGNTREFLVEYIIAVLKVNEVKGSDGHAEDLVAEFLGREHAGLMLHELSSWLRSPHSRLEAWDAQVQYRWSGAELKD
ncbi:hypothetical protein LTR17_016739 [Elasticomyces elasticus]|nr:hypothetical protein LTR17_016739 [Elasticomyces elasticus]